MYIIDRIENNIVIVYDENKNKIELDIGIIDGNYRDGAVIINKNNRWSVDEDETTKRTIDLKNRLNNLFSN